MAVTEARKNGKITAKCTRCGKSKTVPDKGIGRANLAAWKTQHQH